MEDETVRARKLARAIEEAIEAAAKARGEDGVATIRWLAPLMGVSARTIKRWTTADAVPDVLQVVPLAGHLGVNPMLFVSPPEVPEYPLGDYLIRRAGSAGVEEGLRRSRRPRPVKPDDEPLPR